MRWNRSGAAAVAVGAVLTLGSLGIAAAQSTAPPSRDEALAALDRAQAELDTARAYVEAQPDGSTPPTTPPTTTPPTTVPPTPGPGGTLTYQAEAGAPWSFTGAWSPGTLDTHTREVGSTATLRFTGTTVAIHGTTAAHHGIATLNVDGGPPVDVDQYALARTDGALLWTSPALAAGEHVVVITMTNRVNPQRVAFGAPAFSIDRAVVGGAPAGPPPTTGPSTPASTTQAPPPDGAQPVVTRVGRQLQIAGRQWKFAGINADTWFGCWTGERDRTTDAALERYFSELHDRSLTRVWAYRSDPASMALLRRIVAAAERHDQYLMVTLSDGNAGGTQCGSLKGAGYPADGGPVLAHARALVPQFAASPAIAFWEIINEGSNDDPAAAWYATIGREIKRLDPNTLVTGGAGTCWNGTDIRTCQAVNDPSWNDLVNMHEYDDSGGRVSHHAQNTEALAASLGLPWYSGESGLCCGGGPANLTEQRAAELLAAEWTSYLQAPGSAGMIMWDFKWAYGSPSTINLDDPTWGVARTFRHAWQ